MALLLDLAEVLIGIDFLPFPLSSLYVDFPFSTFILFILLLLLILEGIEGNEAHLALDCQLLSCFDEHSGGALLFSSLRRLSGK